MKTPKAVPYLLPPDVVVAVQPWCFTDGSELGDRLDHWDPFVELDLVRIVEVDLDETRRSCQLPEDAAFALVGTWFSNRTRITGDGTVVELGDLRGTVRTALTLTVPGSESGGRLTLRTRLVLRYPGDEPSPISPRRIGAILWEEECHIAVEGGAARFPITAADFKSIPHFPDTAAWFLEWDSNDLEAPVLGGMRLLVNSGHESIPDMLRSGSSDPRAGMLRSFVTFDVAKSLIAGALRNDRFVDDPECFEDGTVGRMIFELIALCWPGMPIPTMRSRINEDTALVNAEIQAHLGILA
ncbi:hypothetical protein [Rhodococcus sp. AH-ZY2]|uniref:hypothetical protein n=1 Tax=Rhodococcus sp. AH-ZY2 TaxID=3047468 RepID=UPI0027DF94D4|nr:hypothetical protein [Rhodococcus sp. AH-ZY2]WML64548.1 hypothetical protein QNA09_07050 [Rhodococcus sp. AH-ZY2]